MNLGETNRFGNPGQPSGIHVNVRDYIHGSERPEIKENSIRSFAKGFDTMLRRNLQQFTLEIQLQDATKLVCVWVRAGATAGYATWIWKDCIQAVSIVLAGLNDAEDNRAIEQARSLQGITISETCADDMRGQTRPLVATIYYGTEAVTKTPITPAAIGLAQTFCTQLKAEGERLPVGKAQPLPPPRQFYQLMIRDDGRVQSAMWPSLDMLDAPDLKELMAAFSQNLEGEAKEFRQIIRFREWPMVIVQWRDLHPTAAVADLSYGSQEVDERLLLLSGKDADADEAAIRTMEGSLRRDGDFANALTQIRTAPRPLLVCIGSQSFEKSDLVVNLIEWALAAAYFVRLAVL